MTKSILTVLTTAVLTTACGGGDATQVSAAAPPAPPAITAPAPPPAPVPVDEPIPVPVAEPAKAPARAAAPRRNAAPAAAPVSAPAPRTAAAPAAPAVPEYREFRLPAGTVLPLALKTALASDVNEVEDAVRATLTQPITVDGYEVLAAGTEVAGTVTEAERSGRVKGRARIGFQFTSLRHDSERLALRTDPIVHEAEATKGEDATKIGVGAGAGAVIGGLIGGKAGAAKGAAIGGAAGTGAVLATRGKEVRLEPGTEVPVRLTAPLTVRVQLP